MVSMKDIAKRCNVSVATVSKALNGYSDIGKAKRDEIQAVAKEMGYFPNSSARALKTNRSYDLGILFADNLHSGLTHDYFAAILDSFKVTAESKGYDITFTSMNMVANRRMSYYEHCRYRGLDGVVIANIDFTTSEVLELVRSSLPVVTIDFVFDGRVAIVSDNVKGMKDLVDYAVSMGHRKIAYIHGDNNSVTRDRLSSFHRTLAEHNITVPDSYVKASRYRDGETTEKRMEELKNLLINSTLIKLEEDLAYLQRMYREEKEKVVKIVPEKKLIEAFTFIENVKGEDLLQKPWEPDSDLRIKLNIFYLYYWMIKEAV